MAPLAFECAYQPPYDWEAMLAFLRMRAMAGVEAVAGGRYTRTVCAGGRSGTLSVLPTSGGRLLVTLDPRLADRASAILPSVTRLFDLDCAIEAVVETLGADPRLSASVAARPGLRVPGAFDGFELALRAILGQQVSVKSATTLAGRLCAAFGEQLEEPLEGLERLSPTAGRLARASVDDLAALGIISARAHCIIGLAREVDQGRLVLDPDADAEATVRRLLDLPGIGPWTAGYIAMRALGRRDTFLPQDLVVRQRLGGVTPRQAANMAEAWRPWRSYAVLHLWHMGEGPPAVQRTTRSVRPDASEEASLTLQPPRNRYAEHPDWREACRSGPAEMDRIILECIATIHPPLDRDDCITLSMAFHTFCLHGQCAHAYDALAMLEQAPLDAEFGPCFLQASHAILFLDDLETAARLLARDRAFPQDETEWSLYYSDCVALAIEARRDPASAECMRAVAAMDQRHDDDITYNECLIDACGRLAAVPECASVVLRLMEAMLRNSDGGGPDGDQMRRIVAAARARLDGGPDGPTSAG